MELRKHQLECVHKIKEHFDNEDKALIKMFCGAGKSFVIYHCLLEFGNNLSVIVVPSINLITQFNKDYLLDKVKQQYNKNKFDKQFELITICSKNELPKEKNNFTFTTEDDEIIEFLEKEDDKICLITYQSFKKLATIIKENYITIDLLCFDEAHHILGENMKDLLFSKDETDESSDDDNEEYTVEEALQNYPNDKLSVKFRKFVNSINNCDDNESVSDISDINSAFIDTCVNKTLFFTATPQNKNGIMMYEPYTYTSINEIEYDIIDDENTTCAEEPHCGKMIYEYMHTNGVNDNILNDFKIRVDMYTENTDTSVFEAISRSILETRNTRVLTFHSRSETVSDKSSNVKDFSNKKKEFIECFNKVKKNEFPKLKNKYKNIEFVGITANTKNRIDILNQFDQTSDDDIFIIASCKTIGEGVDTKKANMVCFVDPKQSYIEIVQNIGRVCRKQDNLATVLIPTYVDVEKYKDCKGNAEKVDEVIRKEMSKTGNFNGILNVLSALRQEDPYMFELCLKYPETYTKKEISNSLEKKGLILEDKEYDKKEIFKANKIKYNDKITEKENLEKLSDKMKSNIQVVNQKILEDDITIDKGYNKMDYFVKTENDKYMKVKNKNNVKEKVERPNRNIKPNIHTNDEIKVLWGFESDLNSDKKIYGGFIKATVISSSEEQWMDKLDEVKKFIDNNERRPNKESKNQIEKKLGWWIGSQINTYKKHVSIMKNKKIRILWEDFIEKYKEYFKSNKEIWIKKYNNLSNLLNNKINLNDKKNKLVKDWMHNQKQHYNKKRGFYNDNELKTKWELLIDKYKDKFLSFEEKWIKTLEYCDNYIKINKIRPKKDSYEYGWITSQIVDYKKKKHMMKINRLREIWDNFTNKHNEIFKHNDDLWHDNYNKLLEYITEHNIYPNCKKEETKFLAKWYSHQEEKVKKSDLSEEKMQKINKLKELFPDIFKKNDDIWVQKLFELKNYINENKKLPSQRKQDKKQFELANWMQMQKRNYNTKDRIMKRQEIRQQWEEFMEQYKEYFRSDEEKWSDKLEDVKNYMKENKKRPTKNDDDDDIQKMCYWISNQKKNYKNETQIMKQSEIRKKWEEFMTEYQEYLSGNSTIQTKEIKSDKNKISKKKVSKKRIMESESESESESDSESEDEKKPIKKLTTIKQKEDKIKETEEQKRMRILTEYQELTKKMSIQKSYTTKDMFEKNKDLWHQYHDNRDFSFQGYDNQNEIPVNKIISYLETKKNHKLRILDLGCGRNIIYEHFKDNKKFNITGYDYVSFNNSIETDISNLPDEDESVKVCVYSQSLMGSNWKEYLNEGKRVLEYNGEMIISESVERYDIVKKYLKEIGMYIKKEDYNETNRWFYIFAIKE